MHLGTKTVISTSCRFVTASAPARDVRAERVRRSRWTRRPSKVVAIAAGDAVAVGSECILIAEWPWLNGSRSGRSQRVHSL